MEDESKVFAIIYKDEQSEEWKMKWKVRMIYDFEAHPLEELKKTDFFDKLRKGGFI